MISANLIAANCSDDTPIINSENGKICGIIDKSQGKSAHAYLGIPYAKPPINELRWQAPQKKSSWKPKIFRANQFGASCTQANDDGFIGQEDCLYLNVWKPIEASEKPYPVLVYIHGGWFLVGSGSSSVLNGTYTASTGKIIVVTLNYRLGSLGFLRYQGQGANIAGNFAILDQIAALQWVQDNIEEFNGDPNQVTLAGESAGALSVGLHLFSVPKNNDLFQAGIMESNAMSVPYWNANKAVLQGEKFVRSLCSIRNLSALDCPKDAPWLRALPIATIMEAQSQTIPDGGIAGLLFSGMTDGMQWAPIVGIAPIVSQPFYGYSNSTLPKPYVFGFNKDEGVFFVPNASTFSKESYIQILENTFGLDNSKRILQFTVNGTKPYNPQTYAYDGIANMTPSAQAMARVITDYAFASASLTAARNAMVQMNAVQKPTFGYYFTQESSFNFSGLQRCDPSTHFICHANELPFVFHNFIENISASNETEVSHDSITANEQNTALQMNQSWIGFAKDSLYWQNGFGHAPIESINQGPFVQFNSKASLIYDLPQIVNFQFWSSIGVWPKKDVLEQIPE